MFMVSTGVEGFLLVVKRVSDVSGLSKPPSEPPLGAIGKSGDVVIFS